MTASGSGTTRKPLKVPAGFELVGSDLKPVTRTVTEWAAQVSILTPKGQTITLTVVRPNSEMAMREAIEQAVTMECDGDHESPILSGLGDVVDTAVDSAVKKAGG